jgi:arabinofuranan 3-O-arabinosyltransferase
VCLAIKPVLVLVLLVPLVRSRWRTVAWAIAVPAVSNLVGLALVPDRQDFFSVTVPALLTARVEANSSLWAIGTYFGVPPWLTAAARLLVLVAVVVSVWRLRRHPDHTVGLGVSYALLLLAAFLCFSLGQGYYSLFLVPAFATAVVPGSPFRHPSAWLAGYLCLTLDVWNAPQFPDASFDFYVVHWTAGWLLLIAVLLVWSLRTAGTEDDGEPVLRR